MLTRLKIDNLLILPTSEVEFHPGLICITGETGAGKTLLGQSLKLVFGEKASPKLVGTCGVESWIETEWEVSDARLKASLDEILGDLRPEDEDTIILARKLVRDGKSRSLAWGRSASKQTLQLARSSLFMHVGQGSARELLSPTKQRQMLDAAMGDDGKTLLIKQIEYYDKYKQAANDLQTLENDLEGAARLRQILKEDLRRIRDFEPDPKEYEDLQRQRSMLRHRAELEGGVTTALELLSGDKGSVETSGAALSAIQALIQFDDGLKELVDELALAQEQLQEVTQELQNRLGNEKSAVTLEEIDSRLYGYGELHRLYGGTTESVLEHATLSAQKLTTLEDGTNSLEQARKLVVTTLDTATKNAKKISLLRDKTGKKLSLGVEKQLSDLHMPEAKFQVSLSVSSLGRTGCDLISFELCANPGLPFVSLKDGASGGETSRIALALYLTVQSHQTVGTLLFDELDTGIGGETAIAYAQKLAELAKNVQIICITHLPQVAAYADQQIVVEKINGAATLHALITNEERIQELTRMLGATGDISAAEHARKLMRKDASNA